MVQSLVHHGLVMMMMVVMMTVQSVPQPHGGRRRVLTTQPLQQGGTPPPATPATVPRSRGTHPGSAAAKRGVVILGYRGGGGAGGGGCCSSYGLLLLVLYPRAGGAQLAGQVVPRVSGTRIHAGYPASRVHRSRHGAGEELGPGESLGLSRPDPESKQLLDGERGSLRHGRGWGGGRHHVVRCTLVRVMRMVPTQPRLGSRERVRRHAVHYTVHLERFDPQCVGNPVPPDVIPGYMSVIAQAGWRAGCTAGQVGSVLPVDPPSQSVTVLPEPKGSNRSLVKWAVTAFWSGTAEWVAPVAGGTLWGLWVADGGLPVAGGALWGRWVARTCDRLQHTTPLPSARNKASPPLPTPYRPRCSDRELAVLTCPSVDLRLATMDPS